MAFAPLLVVVAAASDVSTGSGSMGLSFPTSRLWAAPEASSMTIGQTLGAGDTSAVFAEYHANLAHAGLAATDQSDNKIEQERMNDRVEEEETPSSHPEKLPPRLDGLLQENVPEHTGDHVLDRLAALHELVERKRQMRHASHGDLNPGDHSAFLQPKAEPVMGLSMPGTAPEMNMDAPAKPPVSFTETHVDADFPSRPEPPSDSLLDPAEIQDGRINQDGTHSMSSFSASPMGSMSSFSARDTSRSDNILANLNSVTQGLRNMHGPGLRGAPASPQPLSQDQQWPPSLAPLATAPVQPMASHPAHQMDPAFAAAIGAAAPDLSGPMSMSFNVPPAGSSSISPLPPMDNNMVSPVQALMNNADAGYGSAPPAGPFNVPRAPAQTSFTPPAPAQMLPVSAPRPSPNSARLFDAPLPSRPANLMPAMNPVAPQVSPPTATLTSPVVGPAAIYMPPVPLVSSSPLAQVPQPVMPPAPAAVFQPTVPSLSSVSPSFDTGAGVPVVMAVGSSPVGSVDADLQRVNQTTADDEKEIARIQARMAAGAPDVQLWVPNSKPAVQPRMVAQAAPVMTAAVAQAPMANRAQPIPAARPVAQQPAEPKPAQSPQGVASAVGRAPVTPVYDVDGNRIWADNEAMLRDLKGEVANFEQRVTVMEHQEASLLQTDDSDQ